MMNLDEAIQHCEEVAETNERICDTEPSIGLPDIYKHKDEAKKCASEHRQLAEWLKELKAYKEQSGDAISRQVVLEGKVIHQSCDGIEIINGYAVPVEYIENLPSVTPQQKTGHCKNCKYFEYDSVAKVDGIPLIVAHEICKKWGDGCKTKEDGYCFLFEPQERSDEE